MIKKTLYLILLVIIGLSFIAFAVESYKTAWHRFDGQWMPDLDPSLIGPKNYKTLTNMRYFDGGLKGVQGYTKKNTNAPSAEFYRPRSGYHYKKYAPAESHILMQFFNKELSKSVIYDNETALPDTGDFNSTVRHTDEVYSLTELPAHSTGFGDTLTTAFGDTLETLWADAEGETASIWTTFHAFFAQAPNQSMVYSNGAATHVWSGNEANIGSFIVATSAITQYVNGPKDYTVEVSNTINNSSNEADLAVSGASTYFLVGVPRPIQAVKLYASTANASAGKVQGEVWSGTTWQVLSGITDNTSNIQKTGWIEFDSTVDIAKPWYLEGKLLYWYQFQALGSAKVYHVSADYPWQDIKDIWDGTLRGCVGVHVYDSDNADYKDFTLEVQQGSSDLFPIAATVGGLKTDEHVILQFEDKTQAIELAILSGNTQLMTSGVTVNYWSGTTWAPVGAMHDGTAASGVTPLSKTSFITWAPPANEYRYTNFGKYAYAYKLSWDGILGGTGAAEAAVMIDTVYGIPAPLKMEKFKFPVFYRNRVFLCGDLKGNEPNRCDVSAPNAVDVWNGPETSNDGRQSIYFGSGGELTAGTQLYNRYGSNVFTSLAMFEYSKTHILIGSTFDSTSSDRFQLHTIAENVGCPAPHTVTVLEVGYEMVSEELLRNVVVWLSANGPMTFDGSVMQPIKGIDNYFNPTHSDYIGADAFEYANAWYDSYNREWNLRAGTHWFVYDFIRRKWYKKDTGAAEIPQVAFEATDTKGNKYVYGGTDDGYMVQLENGTTWAGTAINHVIETGDFNPAGDPWYTTYMRRLKFAHKVIPESTTLKITQYKDGDSGTSTFSMNLSSGTAGAVARGTIGFDSGPAWLWRFKMEAETSETTDGYQPMGWGYQFGIKREDH